MEVSLSQIKSTLDQISHEVSLGKIPAPVLKDFKLTVDELRVTIWAILTFEEEPRRTGPGSDVALANKLVEFRIKRVIQMLTNLRADIENRRIEAGNPDLKAFSSTLNATRESLAKL